MLKVVQVNDKQTELTAAFLGVLYDSIKRGVQAGAVAQRGKSVVVDGIAELVIELFDAVKARLQGGAAYAKLLGQGGKAFVLPPELHLVFHPLADVLQRHSDALVFYRRNHQLEMALGHK